jgi:hypothetical protein
MLLSVARPPHAQERPVALRPRLAAGLPLSRNARILPYVSDAGEVGSTSCACRRSRKLLTKNAYTYAAPRRVVSTRMRPIVLPSVPRPEGPRPCRMLQANFSEHPF